jgi:diaminohydroxyphosphoribosylaminopyrimidine deaminase/5-amino-6-(5-phosphoribosylamino)uracil reductase
MQVAEFYKVWDRYGALSNFSPHPVRLPRADGTLSVWPTVEHYYQAQKFAGVDDPAASALMEASNHARHPFRSDQP